MTRVQDAAALLPPAFLAFVQRFTAEEGAVGGPSGSAWAAGLPKLLADLLDDWDLTVTGPARTGRTSVVLPVLREGAPLALKVGWPHVEARDEALALRLWDGHGAVRLVAADPHRSALLLEPLDSSHDLRDLDVDAACEVTGELLARLHVPAPPQVGRLSAHVRRHAAPLLGEGSVLPRRMAERTAGLLDDLLSDPACDATLLHGDLHNENVLHSLPGSDRPAWVAIDPNAVAGHPGFEVQPLLRNRRDELGTGSAFRYLVRRRVEVTCDAAGIDEDEALEWSYVHTAINAGWAAKDGDADEVTFCIALLKALDG
ncbi:aminoglycoside phosphotransferase family protein [Pedococcus sp. 2YAF34]|uniref:aminoglycoside phosphotransferase family protein n=1 Tax=Pedococcus sp. 2YAF34 TaxID=3233032 RepID=UPI003F9A48E3